MVGCKLAARIDAGHAKIALLLPINTLLLLIVAPPVSVTDGLKSHMPGIQPEAVAVSDPECKWLSLLSACRG